MCVCVHVCLRAHARVCVCVCVHARAQALNLDCCLIFWDETWWFLSIRVFGLSTTFRSICPPAFFRCLSNSGTFTKLRMTSFIESMGVACSDSVSHNRVQVLSILVLLLTCSQDWTWPEDISAETLWKWQYRWWQ